MCAAIGRVVATVRAAEKDVSASARMRQRLPERLQISFIAGMAVMAIAMTDKNES